MNVIVIGGNGQLGTDVCAAFKAAGHTTTALNHDRMDIADQQAVRRTLGALEPQWIVTTAALHDLDRCEAEPAAAYAVNAVGARNLALFCRDNDVPLMHVSTDYVFDGEASEPYREEDTALPLNIYGNTKLAGERFIQALTHRHQILRVSGLYGAHPCRGKGGNFVDLMLRLGRERDHVRVVDNEVLTPTSTAELARQMVRLAGTDCYGVLHATADGSCSWHAFAAEIFRQAGITVDLQVAGPGEFPAKVPRPAYSVLENAALERAGLNVLGPWQDGLRAYIEAKVGEPLPA